MLSKKDKEWIKDIIKTAVTEALTVEWTVEKVRDDKTGLPLAVIERKTEEVFIPSAFLQILPFYEGAMRGMQEDLNKNNNKMNDFDQKMNVIGNLLMQTENSMKCLASLSDHIKSIDFEDKNKVKFIEDITDGDSDS